MLVELDDVIKFFEEWGDTGGDIPYIGDVPVSMIIRELKEWFKEK